MIADLDASKYTLVEWRISIYGRKASEWAGILCFLSCMLTLLLLFCCLFFFFSETSCEPPRRVISRSAIDLCYFSYSFPFSNFLVLLYCIFLLSGLARWFYVNRLAHENVRWLIQIPRLYSIYKQSGEVESFGQMLRNIFEPLFAVSIDPSSNPPLHYFLQTVVGKYFRALISPICQRRCLFFAFDSCILCI